MGHKFSLGEIVVFTPGAFEVLRIASSGTITRLLPADSGDYQYHVLIASDGTSRRASENQLRPAPPA